MSIAANDLINRYVEAINTRNLAILDEIMVEDYLHHDPNLPADQQRGRDNYKRHFGQYATAFPDYRVEIPFVLHQGDRIAWRGIFVGTNTGELMGIPATGKPVIFTLAGITRVESGRMVEGWVQFDVVSLMQQLGVMPTPAAA